MMAWSATSHRDEFSEKRDTYASHAPELADAGSIVQVIYDGLECMSVWLVHMHMSGSPMEYQAKH